MITIHRLAALGAVVALVATASIVFAADDDRTQIVLTPAVRYAHVDGDKDQFRADHWIDHGLNGGVDELTIDHRFNDDWALRFTGRGIFDENDYALRLEIVNPDIGYIHAWFEEYRKYSEGTGGFYAPFGVRPAELPNDLALRIGRYGVQLGLTLPDIPHITLGYERLTKDGAKSLTQWGAVSQAGVTRRIYPSWKEIDEHTDIVSAAVKHSIGSVNLSGQFRYERFESDTRRHNADAPAGGAVSKSYTVTESYKHDAFFSTFHLESHVNEQFYWALGHLYNSLSGDGSFDLATVPTAAPFDRNWVADKIQLDSDSHVLNASLAYRPWKDLAFYAGLQFEKTDTDGDTDAILFAGAPPTMPTAVIRSHRDLSSTEERVGVRFTRIPHTTLFAEGQWTQRNVDLYERQVTDGLLALERNTDTDVTRQRYTVGFNTAPLPKMTFSARYRHNRLETDYNHLTDSDPAAYSAFINWQQITSDELNARFTIAPISRVRLALQYRLVQSDILTRTDVAPGRKQSGEYDAHIYSVGLTVTPLPRLYLTTALSYQDARTTSFDNNADSIVAYRGDVYSIIAGGGYALTEKLDLNVTYSFSRSDNFNNSNSATGLPLGTDNTRHGLTATLTMNFSETVIGRLTYGWYDYEDDATGGFNDYTAHLIGGSVALRF